MDIKEVESSSQNFPLQFNKNKKGLFKVSLFNLKFIQKACI